MRFVKAASILAGVGLLLLGYADLVTRRADVLDDRERAADVAAKVAASRVDGLVTATGLALLVAAADADPAELSELLGVTVCDPARATQPRCGEAAAAAAVAAAATAPSSTAVSVVGTGTDLPPRLVVAVATPARPRYALVDIGDLGPGIRLVPSGGTGAATLATAFTSGRWAVETPAAVPPSPPLGIGMRSGLIVAGQIVVGTALVVAAIVAIARDHRGLRRQATTDALTGLPNRAAFERTAAALLARVDRERTGACLLLVDLDRFKAVNDTLGHAGGDRVLIEAAGRLRRAVRDTDLVGRWGGDEFVVLLAGISDPLMVPDRVAAITAGLAGIPTVDGGELTAAVGAAVAPLHGTDLLSLLEAADRAMYAAKPAVASSRPPSAKLAR
jgi:diguanylate cyclase (GGDEF)-like protein